MAEDPPPDRLVLRRLAAGVRGLGRATLTPTPTDRVPALLDGARRSVDAISADTEGGSERAQRVAFAVTRLADALSLAREAAGHDPAPDGARPAAPDPTAAPDRSDPDHTDPDHTDPDHTDPASGSTDRTTGTPADGSAAEDDAPDAGDGRPGLDLTTRQAVQVLVATSLAIVVGDLISPSRWYWAVIAAFVVFAGTASRGDVVNRGSQRVVGTIGGVAAGMGLAWLVGDHRLVALVLLFGCVFLALYLVRISQALMAFWITTVLALLYGLIGQFSAETLLVRIEETAVGAAMGMIAGYLVLPKRTREAFGEALDDAVDASDAALAAAIDQLCGLGPETSPVELARDLDDALATLRQRAKPLGNPLPRRRGARATNASCGCSRPSTTTPATWRGPPTASPTPTGSRRCGPRATGSAPTSTRCATTSSRPSRSRAGRRHGTSTRSNRPPTSGPPRTSSTPRRPTPRAARNPANATRCSPPPATCGGSTRPSSGWPSTSAWRPTRRTARGLPPADARPPRPPATSRFPRALGPTLRLRSEGSLELAVRFRPQGLAGSRHGPDGSHPAAALAAADLPPLVGRRARAAAGGQPADTASRRRTAA
ncbi:FUSC family protein [Pseudonocardia benzenivorans]